MAYYFVSDVHARPGERNERFLAWLDAVAGDAEGIFLLGDIFDFWFEYKTAAPKGYEAILERFRALAERGVEIHFLPGNHDLWTEGHLAEYGIKVHSTAYTPILYGKNLYLEHGDRPSIGSFKERFVQRLFRSSLARRTVRALVPHSRLTRFGNRFSRSHRTRHPRPHVFKAEKEGIVRFARTYMRSHPVDLFVFGHLHTPTVYALDEGVMLYVLGDWTGDRKPVCGKLDESGFALV